MTIISTAHPNPGGSDPRRWRALGVLGLVQFMLVVDVSIVNVALPNIQRDLGFTHAGLAWVVNGYVVMAGGLLLLGGRLADMFGRRRLFLIGIGLFAVASATSGAATSPGVLVASRFAQGAGEALAAPAALGLIALLFPHPRERVKAVGIWGGLAGLGGTTGSVISGVLTDVASWRWIFYINLPLALLALVLVPRLVSESRMVRDRPRVDLIGAATVTGGLIAIVYGLLQASTHAWGSVPVLLPLLCGLALLAVAAVTEVRTEAPLIPPRFFRNRTRVVANGVSVFFSAAFFSYVFLLTLFEQQVLRYSPLQGGLGYLPMGLGIGAGMGIGAALMPRVGVRALIAVSFIGAAAGLLATSSVHVGSSYLGGVLPGMIVFAVFSGLSFAPLINAALHEVTGQDSSLASGVQNTMQQIGGALGLACLVTLALRHAAAQTGRGVPAGVAAANGYAVSFRVGAALLAIGGLLALALFQRVSTKARNPLAESSGPDPAGGADALVSPAGL
ncbi:MAG TPA: MFS transporter [Solirubrobacteraceae bacterium]|nr:MFS transporter [Solirubrobacteraceae bacterium]